MDCLFKIIIALELSRLLICLALKIKKKKINRKKLKKNNPHFGRDCFAYFADSSCPLGGFGFRVGPDYMIGCFVGHAEKIPVKNKPAKKKSIYHITTISPILILICILRRRRCGCRRGTTNKL